MASFPSFSSFQVQGGIKGTGESLEEFKKKQQLLIANDGDAQMLSSGSEDEEKEVLKKLKRKRKKEKKKQLKKLLENLGEDHAQPSSNNIKLIGVDFYIDPNGDVSNLKFVNRNQPIPAYKPPKPTKNFNPALFKGVISSRGLVKRLNNIWVISGLDDPESNRSPFSNLKNILCVQVEPLYLYRGKETDDYGDLIKLSIDDKEEKIPMLENRTEAGGSLQFLEKCREMDRLVTRNPNMVEYWVDFIKLQDEMDTSIDKWSASMKNRITEKKMAIVERALDENPNSDILLSIFLDLKALQLDSRQMLGLWDSALEKNQTSFCLWKSYLDYRLSNAASFSLQSILESFEECLEKMSFVSISTDRDQKLLFFISRLCAFFKAMGYFERAIAIFQALIELNCRSPPEMKWLERIGLFEEFWDSERARFGDLDAKGWIQRADKEEPRAKPASNYRQFDQIEDPYTRWKCQELLYKKQQWLPLRNSIQDQIDDPFQTVMYQDIEPFLVQILTAKGKQELIGAFLSFLKMPNSCIASSLSPYQQDHFLYQDFDNIALFRQFMTKEDGPNISVSFPFPCFPYGVEGLFGDGISWPTVLGPSTVSMLREYKNGYIDYVSQVLEQSTHFIPNNSYYLLWTQSISDPKQAEKTAKKILKSQPMNLSLWNVYAQLVLKLKGNTEARKIYQTTLSMYKSFPESAQIGVGVLYSSLALLEWENGSIDRATAVLIAHSERKPPVYTKASQETIMNARSVLLEGAMDELQVLKKKGLASLQLYSNDTITVLHLLQNAAILEFFIRRDAQAIIDVCNRALGLGFEKTMLQELIYQMFVHLLVKVMRSNATFKPALIRSVLEEALNLFPSNTLLLSIFGMTEGKNRLDARMRRFLNDQMNKSNSFPLYLFSIWTEVHQTSSPNLAVIRSRIDRATQLFPGNPSIWMLAIHFEENTSRKKQLFYQAIATCPYSKSLYLMAFEDLRDWFTPDELEEIYGIMDDKEIRIMQPLDT